MLDLHNALSKAYTGHGLPQIKNLTLAVKNVISSAKPLDSLTLAFQEQMIVFPTKLLVDLAPHPQQICALHIMSRYSHGHGDEVMVAA